MTPSRTRSLWVSPKKGRHPGGRAVRSRILRGASADGYFTACSAEKSGQDEFDFEYGDEFARHIESFHPTVCKLLVRYNPEGDKELNQRRSCRLSVV